MPTHRRSYLFRLSSEPICYLWTGFGPLETPPDAVDPEGATWSGAGELLSIPALKALINGAAERVRFSLSGVSVETMRLAREDRQTVEGATLRLGFVDFDENWQVAAVNWEWLGVADVLIVESQQSEAGRTRTIAISCASADTLLSNPPLTFFTHADQTKRSPTDMFCNQVAQITMGSTRRFGPK